MHRQIHLLPALLITLLGCGDPDTTNSDAPPPATLILTNGHIVTVDQALGEQEAIAITGHTISAVGSSASIQAYAGAETQVIDLAGQTVIPGLIEGHGHFLNVGRAKQILDLTQANSFARIVTQVAQAADAAEPGEWIFGRGWHQDKWTVREPQLIDGVPINKTLNQVSGDNPVILVHASGHAAFANDRALQAAGIGADTAAPAGGIIVRDDSGRATGLLRETAQDLVDSAAQQYLSRQDGAQRRATFLAQVQLAGDEALRYGVTSFHDAGTPLTDIDRLRKLELQQGLPIRLYVMINDDNQTLAEKLPDYFWPYEDNDFLTVRSIKRQIDGALGAHGAWLLQPYTDLPDTSGLVLTSLKDMAEIAALALQHNFQLATHAIGTRGNRETLDLYERAWGDQERDGTALRWRVEHAQHVYPEDITRFARLGVIAAVQGVHCTSDGPWIPTRLGMPRTRITSYRWRDMLDGGVRINNGTDAPVESLNPFASLQASVTRRMNGGARFFPEQAMTRMEALKSYTLDNAYSAFEETHKGSISPGKLADLVVLSADYLSVPADEIGALQAVMTIVGGDIRYRRDASQP
ncbi:MAG: amidohydrolase [Pseudomonadota bacterium]